MRENRNGRECCILERNTQEKMRVSEHAHRNTDADLWRGTRENRYEFQNTDTETQMLSFGEEHVRTGTSFRTRKHNTC